MPNYNKMSKKYSNETAEILEQIDEIIPQPVEIEESAEEVVEETPEPVVVEGVVTDCAQMYVRSEPSVNSKPLGVIKRDTKVQIYETDSTEEFYSVCTENGLEGFCMKKFISVL